MARLTIDQLNQAVGMLLSGSSQRNVAAFFGVSHSVISRAWARYQLNSVHFRHGGGRVRKTTARTDRLIRFITRRRRTVVASELVEHVREVNNVNISQNTVRRRLHEVNLRARRPARHPTLSIEHKRNRLYFCREHLNWNLNQWSNCLFTDESRFKLKGADGRTRIWREKGERYQENCMMSVEPYGGGSVTVWAGIFTGGRTELVVLINQTMNAERYLNQVLRPIVLPFAIQRRPNFSYVDDNARPHRARIINNFFEENEIPRLIWPSRSPDLNPIEHVWDVLGRRLSNRRRQPVNLNELANAVMEEWPLVSQDVIDNCINSMPRRCQAVITARGGATRY